MEALKIYSSTASLVSSVARLFASACSGASTIKVAPWSVSGRVVYTVIFSSLSVYRESPPLRRRILPIQSVCIFLTFSGQSSLSRSSSRRSAYAVIFSIHWRKILLGYRRAAALAAAVYNFLIGKAGLTGRTPVNGELLLVGQSLLEHLYKDPLGPFIKLGVCGVDFHIPVINSSDLVDLPLDIRDVGSGGNCRMDCPS